MSSACSASSQLPSSSSGDRHTSSRHHVTSSEDRQTDRQTDRRTDGRMEIGLEVHRLRSQTEWEERELGQRATRKNGQTQSERQCIDHKSRPGAVHRCLEKLLEKISFRRRLSAEGAKPESNDRKAIERSCMYVCMFFKDISRYRALSESKVVPDCSPVNSTLHRHGIIRVRFLTSTRHVKIEKRLLP